MPRLTDTRVPSYRLHRATGQAVVTLNGRDVYLGLHGTPQSREKYNGAIAEWLAAGRRLDTDPEPISVAEVVNDYRKYAEGYYRRVDGTPTGEAARVLRELSPLTKLFARTRAAEFGPLKLKAAREAMIEAGWCRTSVNHAVGTIKRCFKWAVENEMVPPSIFHGLQAVAGLRAGRCEAPERDAVKPVLVENVLAILPHVSPQVGAMVQLQLLTGMRPGEVCIMRARDVDTTGELWVYHPAHHKSEHHGHAREIYLGPKAQGVLRPFLRADLGAYLFDPREAENSRRQVRHARRRTPLSCGNRPGTNRKETSLRRAGDHYTNESYRRAIVRGCDKADSWAKGAAIVGNGERVILRWHPHQLRHTAATELRKSHGLEAAQVILGHRTLSVTQVYAERNVEAAKRVMSAVG